MRLFILSLFVLNFSAMAAEEPKLEMTLDQLDRTSIVERLRKAYSPVSTKIDGAWIVSNADSSETWTYQGGAWKCPNSKYNCADFIPVSFKWFGSGKGWLGMGGPQRRLEFDFQGSARGLADRGAGTTAEEEEAGGVTKFEGKRNALEVWEWESSLASGLKVSVSLRDYLIESQVESVTNPKTSGAWLDYGARGGGRIAGDDGMLYATSVACFVLAIPNRYLPILQEGKIESFRRGSE